MRSAAVRQAGVLGAERPSVWYVSIPLTTNEIRSNKAARCVEYAVQRVGRRYYCQCPDFFFRRLPAGGSCKHIKVLRRYLRRKRRAPSLVPALRASLAIVEKRGMK